MDLLFWLECMSNKVYRIGEAAKLLEVKTSVLRFWEEEFSQIRPKRTDKGQRYYSEKDMETLIRIRNLLYDEGMTISGAQRVLQKQRNSFNQKINQSEKINLIHSKFQKNTQLNFTGIHPKSNSSSESLNSTSTQNASTQNSSTQDSSTQNINTHGVDTQNINGVDTQNINRQRLQNSDVSCFENCKESSYITSVDTSTNTYMDISAIVNEADQAATQTTPPTQTPQTTVPQIDQSLEAQTLYKESIIEIQTELKSLLNFLSSKPTSSFDKNLDKKQNTYTEKTN